MSGCVFPLYVATHDVSIVSQFDKADVSDIAMLTRGSPQALTDVSHSLTLKSRLMRIFDPKTQAMRFFSTFSEYDSVRATLESPLQSGSDVSSSSSVRAGTLYIPPSGITQEEWEAADNARHVFRVVSTDKNSNISGIYSASFTADGTYYWFSLGPDGASLLVYDRRTRTISTIRNFESSVWKTKRENINFASLSHTEESLCITAFLRPTAPTTATCTLGSATATFAPFFMKDIGIMYDVLIAKITDNKSATHEVFLATGGFPHAGGPLPTSTHILYSYASNKLQIYAERDSDKKWASRTPFPWDAANTLPTIECSL